MKPWCGRGTTRAASCRLRQAGASESPMPRILFVCTENRLRSATAEAVFSEYQGVEAIGAGTNVDARTPVTGDLIEWADVILVMEEAHRRCLMRRFPDLVRNKKIGVLGLRDIYAYMEPVLVDLLRRKVPAYVRLDSVPDEEEQHG